MWRERERDIFYILCIEIERNKKKEENCVYWQYYVNVEKHKKKPKHRLQTRFSWEHSNMSFLNVLHRNILFVVSSFRFHILHTCIKYSFLFSFGFSCSYRWQVQFKTHNQYEHCFNKLHIKHQYKIVYYAYQLTCNPNLYRCHFCTHLVFPAERRRRKINKI